MQVVVEDADGAFVPGLAVDDFELFVGGQRRDLLGVLEVRDQVLVGTPSSEAIAEPVQPAPPAAPIAALPHEARRAFLVFVDLTRATARSLRYVRGAALEFVEERLGPTDYVGISVYSPRGGLDLPVPFSSDHRLATDWLSALGSREAMQRLAPAGEGIDLQAIASIHADVADLVQEIERVRVAMGAEDLIRALGSLGDALAGVQGHKHVLFFSNGLPDAIFLDAGFRASAQNAVDGARAAGMVIHTLHPGVLPVSDVHDVSDMSSRLRINEREPGVAGLRDPLRDVIGLRTLDGRQLLNYIAEETGGTSSFYRHNLSDGIEAVDHATRSYYVVNFPLTQTDPATLAIELRIKRPEVRVKWAPTALFVGRTSERRGPTESLLRVAAAMEFEADPRDFETRLRVATLPTQAGKGKLSLALEIPFEELSRLLEEADTLGFEVLALAVDPTRNVADYAESRFTLGDKAESLRQLREPLRYHAVLTVPPDEYYLKLLLRELGTGKLVSHSRFFTVPEEGATALRLSDPVIVSSTATGILGESVAAAAMSPASASTFNVQGRPLFPIAGGPVRAGDSIEVFALARGLTAHPFTGRVQPIVEAYLRHSNGAQSELHSVSLNGSEIGADGGLRVWLSVTLPAELPSGPWRLGLRVGDQITGRSAASEAEF